MTVISKPDSSMQRLAPGEIGPEVEGWYREAPKVGDTFAFWELDCGNGIRYCETSKVISVFGTLDGYIIKTENSVYAIREFLDG